MNPPALAQVMFSVSQASYADDRSSSQDGTLIQRAKARLGLLDGDNENRLWVEGLMMHLDVPLPANVTMPPDHPMAGVPLRLMVRADDAARNLATMMLQPIDMRWDATGHEREKLGLSNGIRGVVADQEIRNGNELWVAFCFWMKEFPEEAGTLLENYPYLGMSVDMGSGAVEIATDVPNCAVFTDPSFYGGTILFKTLAADPQTTLGAIAEDSSEESSEDADDAAASAGAQPFHELPLADRGHPWDAGAAESRIRAWAGAKDGPNAKYKRAFMYADSANAAVFGSYKLPYCDVIGGELHAIPKAIFAIAGVLHGSRGGANIPAAAEAKIKSVVTRWYGQMRRAFKDDSLTSPFSEGSILRDESSKAKAEDKSSAFDHRAALILSGDHSLATEGLPFSLITPKASTDNTSSGNGRPSASVTKQETTLLPEMTMDLDKIVALLQASNQEASAALRELIADLKAENATLREKVTAVGSTAQSATETLRAEVRAEVTEELKSGFETEKTAAVETAVTEKATGLTEQIDTLKATVAELTARIETLTTERDVAVAEVTRRDESAKATEVLASRITVLSEILPVTDEELTDEFKASVVAASDDRFENMKLSRELTKLRTGGTTDPAPAHEAKPTAHASLKNTGSQKPTNDDLCTLLANAL